MADEIRLVKDLRDVQRRHNRGEPMGLHANNIITRAIETAEDNTKLREALRLIRASTYSTDGGCALKADAVAAVCKLATDALGADLQKAQS